LTEAAEKPGLGALSSANPPPRQKPITPIFPVQASRAASHVAAASISSKTGPDPAVS
jgi:hypothetical protein